MNVIIRIKNYINGGQERSSLAKKNIIVSFFAKIVSIVISLLIVPITINYINTEQYGIWLTLSSIVAWISYFDMGFAHGFRNRFAEAKAKGELELAGKYVSTSYFVLTIIFLILFIAAAVCNSLVNWADILNVDIALNPELTKTFFILLSFFCANLVLNVFNTLLLADQRPALSAVIGVLGQLLVLMAIYILTETTSGSLSYLAFALSGIPCVVLLVASVCLFTGKYWLFRPAFSRIDLSLTKNIIGLGGKFFIIQMSMLFVFQFVNIILSRSEGPEVVAQYNIAYKYFNVIYLFLSIILTPFWSAFTDAYTKSDYQWMKKAYKSLSRIWYLAVVGYFILLFCSSIVYDYWLPNLVKIPFSLSAMMGIYILVLSKANIYMFLINGIGKVQMQLYVYLLFALISIPLMVVVCGEYGACGILGVISLVYVVQIVIGHMQLHKIMNGEAAGIWNK